MTSAKIIFWILCQEAWNSRTHGRCLSIFVWWVYDWTEPRIVTNVSKAIASHHQNPHGGEKRKTVKIWMVYDILWHCFTNTAMENNNLNRYSKSSLYGPFSIVLLVELLESIPYSPMTSDIPSQILQFSSLLMVKPCLKHYISEVPFGYD